VAILHFPPGMPALLRSAIEVGIGVHIGGAALGLVSGAVAATARKGGPLHRRAGQVFGVAMLVMAAVAALVAVPLRETSNIIGGVFACYLVATAWITARRPPGQVGALERVGLGAAIVTALGMGWVALQIAAAGEWLMIIPTSVLAAAATLSAAADWRVIRRGGLDGRDRLARHLWRMSVAFFIATGSFFLGKQADMPAFMRGSPILVLLAFAPLLLMAWWLVRVRRHPSRGAIGAPPAGAIEAA
jgi:uncharacterized membrane protein